MYDDNDKVAALESWCDMNYHKKKHFKPEEGSIELPSGIPSGSKDHI